MGKYNFLSIPLFLKGMAMGIADLIPGISGGTIAFITGIYQDLLESIKSISIKSILTIRKKGFINFFKYINGYLLLSVFLGIVTSIFTFSNLISYLMLNYSIPFFSFFLGLIISSIYIILIDIKLLKISNILLLLTSILASYYIISMIKPIENDNVSYLYIFLSGFFAITAMILPGISGSFILLILGSYDDVINLINNLRQAIFNLDLDLLYSSFSLFLFFLLGLICGLKTFSNLITYLIKKYKEKVMVSLGGFVLGSIPLLWPWKQEGNNVFPTEIKNNFLYESMAFFILGIFIIIIFAYFNKKTKLLS